MRPASLLAALLLLGGLALVLWRGLDRPAAVGRVEEHPGASSAPRPARRGPARAPTELPAPELASLRPITGAGADIAQAVERNDRAVALLEDGEVERALELFEQCLAQCPDEPIFANNLASALVRAANRAIESEELEQREKALGLIERARELAPGRADLDALHERWSKALAAEDGFWRTKTLHFELSFDGDRPELLGGTGPLEDELESAYLELGEAFGFFPVEDGHPRIRVVLLAREQFDAVTGLGDWAGGVFDGTVRVPVENLGQERERLKRTLRHELVHAFVHHAGGPRVPGWLNEGLAQWLEPPFLADRAQGVLGARKKLVGRELPPLSELRGSLASWKEVERIELAYALSLAFVEYLQRTYGERLLYELVLACKAEPDVARAFETLLAGRTLASVEEDFASFDLR